MDKEFKKEIYELVAAFFFAAIVFVGIISEWDMPVKWEYVILLFFLTLFIWSLYKSLEPIFFYRLSVIYLALTIFLEVLGESTLVLYSSIFMFYSLTFGLIEDVIKRRLR